MKLTVAELASDCFPEDVMLSTNDAAQTARIRERVMTEIKTSNKKKRYTVRKTLFIVLAALLIAALGVSAYASGLFQQKLTPATGTVTGRWIWHNPDGTTETQIMRYPDAGYVLTAEETAAIPNGVEVRANWLPSAKDMEGKWLRVIQDPGGSDGPIPYEVRVQYAIPGLTLVLNGDCEIVREDEWNGYARTEITCRWQEAMQHGLGEQHFLLLKNEEMGHILQIAGADSFEILEKIAENLEVRDTGVPVDFNPDFNIGMMNVGRG